VFLPLDGKTNMPEMFFESSILLCATLKVMFIKMRKKKIILFQLMVSLKSFSISIHFLVNGGNNSTVNYFRLKRIVKGKKIKGRRSTNRVSFIRFFLFV
jgi:hypothetical protein